VDSNGRTTFVADAHRDDGKRFVVRADERLTAFVELEAATLFAVMVNPSTVLWRLVGWVVCLAAWMPFSVNCTKPMYVGMMLHL